MRSIILSLTLLFLINLSIAVPLLDFVSPTPANATSTANTSVIINVSINESSLDNVTLNWNGTNYSIYDSSLVAMFNFDNVSAIGENNAHAVDVSQYGNNATTFNGDSTWTTSGIYNSAMSFDGTGDYISIPASASLNTWSTEITVSTWVYPTDATAQSILSQRDNGGNNNWQLYGGVLGYIYFNFWDVGNTNRECFTSNSTDLNSWNYLTVTYNGSEINIYKNGQLIRTCSFSQTMKSDSVQTNIGSDGVGNSFPGVIDEVRIYNRAINSSEIEQLYKSNFRKSDSQNWIFETNETLTNPDEASVTINYSVCANDLSNNLNCTQTRTIHGIGDEIAPEIAFDLPTPANATSTANISVQFNISINESSLGNVTWNWNGTNFSVYDSSLIMMYNFDNISALGEDSTTAKDFSVNNFTGTIFNTALTEGKYGLGLSFDQTGYFDTGDKLTTLTDNFTISFWVNPNATQVANADIFGNHGGAQVGIVMQSEGTNNIYRFIYGDGTGWAGTSDTITLSDEIWQHVTIVKNSTHCTIYHNGILNFSNVCESQISPSPENLFLGQGIYVNHFMRLFNGKIDEFRIYNRTLSDGEISQNYQINLNKYDTSNWTLYVNETNLSGSYTYYGCAADLPGNENCTQTRIVSANDTLAPQISLVFPLNQSNLSSTVEFNFTATDDLAPTLNCSVYLDSILNATNESVSNGTLTNFTVAGLTEGNHYWNISCSDGDNSNTSETWNFTVDLTNPVVDVLAYPTEGLNLSSNVSIDLNFTVSDALTGIDPTSCVYSLDGGAGVSIATCSNTTFNVSAGEGLHNISINASDYAGNTVTSDLINFTIDMTEPSIGLINPVEGQNFSTNESIELNITYDDGSGTGLNPNGCSYLFDGGGPVPITNCENTTFNVSSGEGQHNITVSIVDMAGNYKNSDLINFTIDLTAPTATINYPTEGLILASNESITLNFTVSDALTGIDPTNCAYILDGAPALISNCENTTFNVSSGEGQHNISVVAKDIAGNTVTSDLINFTISFPTSNPITPSSSDSSGSTTSLSISVDTSCNNNTITTNVGSVSINVLDENTGASVYSGTSDSSGNALFNACGRVVRVYANKDGYRSIDSVFTLDSCSCLTPAVVPPAVVPPTPPVVTPPVVTPTNTTTPPAPPVVVPTTPVVPTFTGPTTGRVGESSTFEVGSCPDCTVRVESPDGRKTTLTPTSGRITLPLTLAGTYRLSLLRSGEVVKSLSVSATAPVAPAVAPAVPAEARDNGMGFALIVLVLLVVVGGVAYYMMSRK